MTTDYKVLWGLKTQLANISCESNNTNCVKYLADFTRTMITQGKTDIAARCFRLAEKAFIKGDKTVKSVISTIFLYSLCITIATHNCENLLPDTLKEELRNVEKIMNIERNENIDEQ